MAGQHRIGKYVAERTLGTGSFATVWLAHDEILEVQVAIKVLADNWARNADIRRRFIEEARLMRRIDHDRVVRIFDVDELSDGRPYFVMAVADRGTLHERIHDLGKGTPMPTDAALRLGLEICEALSIVHDFGVVHRDIKPSNVLFRSVRNHERVSAQRAGRVLGDDAVMIGDFGLAKDLAVASGFTLAAGTPAYMAPEQANPTSVIDRRVDVFATAAVIYELLAGHPAFASETLSGVRRSRAESLAQPLIEVRPDLPEALSDVLAKGMARFPDDRFDSCFALADALTQFLPGAATKIAAPRSVVSPAPPAGPRPAAPPAGSPPLSAMPPPTSLPRGPVRMELTGAAGRVEDLMPGSRLIADSPRIAVAVTERLVRPFTTTVVGPLTPGAMLITAGLRSRADMDADHVQDIGSPLVAEADAVAVVFGAGETAAVDMATELAATLKAAEVGPYVVDAVVVETPGHDAARVVEALKASPVGATLFPTIRVAAADEIGELQRRVTALADMRGVVMRAASGLRVLQLATAQAPAGAAKHAMSDAMANLVSELPVLTELGLLREIVAGRTVLPRWLRTELSRLFLHSQPALRLGLDEDADPSTLRRGVVDTIDRYRTLENTGRIPFSARSAMAVAHDALARMHAELAGFA